MANLTIFAANRALEQLTGVAAYAMPAQFYVALCTTTPTPSAAGIEVSTVGTGYARQPVIFGPAVDGATANIADLAYAVATGTWGTVSHWEVWDAVTGGTRWWFGQLVNKLDGTPTPKGPITAGDKFRFDTGEIRLAAG